MGLPADARTQAGRLAPPHSTSRPAGARCWPGRRGHAPLTVATEAWPPNLATAARTLRPHGVHVVAADDAPTSPSPEGPSTSWSAATRSPPGGRRSPACCGPGGTYFSQQVGPASVFELVEHFLGPQPEEVRRRPPSQPGPGGGRGGRARGRGPAIRGAPHRVLRRRRGRLLPAQGRLDGAGLHGGRLPRPSCAPCTSGSRTRARSSPPPPASSSRHASRDERRPGPWRGNRFQNREVEAMSSVSGTHASTSSGWNPLPRVPAAAYRPGPGVTAGGRRRR